MVNWALVAIGSLLGLMAVYDFFRDKGDGDNLDRNDPDLETNDPNTFARNAM